MLYGRLRLGNRQGAKRSPREEGVISNRRDERSDFPTICRGRKPLSPGSAPANGTIRLNCLVAFGALTETKNLLTNLYRVFSA
jgi:hypothetical protein